MPRYEAPRVAIREESVDARSAAMGPIAIVGSVLAALVFVACSPVERAAYPVRASGTSVADHWATLLEIEDPRARTAAMAAFATTFGPEDADVVRELATSRFRRQRAIDDLILLSAWGELDLDAAMNLTLAARSPAAQAYRQDGAFEWAVEDPMTAFAQIGIQDRFLRPMLVRGWYESGEPGLSEFVLSTGSSQAGQHLVARYAAELRFDKGAAGVAAWLDSVRTMSDVPQIMIVHAHRKGIAEMAVADPDAAIAYCDLHCDEPYGDNARERLADFLGVLGEGEQAVRWLESAEDADQEQRSYALRAAFRQWALSDQPAALAWAEDALPKYRDREWFLDTGRLVLGILTRKAPERAVRWTEVIPEGKERVDSLIAIGRRWRELDEDAAEAWLETSPLDEEARQTARTPVVYKNSRRKPAQSAP